ncbi:MAG: YceD family protein [bacterium]
MAKGMPYQVLVRELPTHRRFEVSPVQVAEWLKGLPMRDALGAPDDDAEAGQGVAELDLYADGAHAFAAGTFHGERTVACSRCINPVKLAIDEKLRVTFMPRHEIGEDDDEDKPAGDADADEGPEVAEDDLDVFPFDGERVDLEPLFREQFVLAVPYAPLCAETCKGLCPQCGIDRNTASCSCTPPIDPRLAALKGLKIPS